MKNSQNIPLHTGKWKCNEAKPDRIVCSSNNGKKVMLESNSNTTAILQDGTIDIRSNDEPGSRRGHVTVTGGVVSNEYMTSNGKITRFIDNTPIRHTPKSKYG